MIRKKILWLVSWYPNRSDRFDGDFIQRHARAAAIKNDIHVIFVKSIVSEREMEEEWNYVTGLTEQLIYFRNRTGPFRKWKQFKTWKKAFTNAVDAYISKNGFPDCVHVHIPWKAGLIGIWVKNKYHLPFILSEHWGIYDSEIKNPAYRKLLRKIYNESGAFISVSQYLATRIEETMNKRADVILPNVVDTSLFHIGNEKYSKFTFIHVSNM
ncbi:MAG: glycosyltransferase, partial [Flavisolibacter sp.]